MTTRRAFIATATAGITLLPFAARAAAHTGDMFPAGTGQITVFPVQHASFVMQTPGGVIYNDPVGDPALYADLPPPDLILVTHEHGDHFNVETLTALVGETTQLITNPAVFDMLPAGLQARATSLANGASSAFGAIAIDAVPAYNITEGRTDFHPEGRDNGYVLTIEGARVYIAGDTEDIPEMRALTDIMLAFVPMNLPFTMDAAQAASAINEFAPQFVYPYHYRGRDNGTQDPAEFAAMVETSKVMMGPWYS
jgi:L-ascorbate metabolism protein UlaG (beta-lactamase superfamily)